MRRFWPGCLAVATAVGATGNAQTVRVRLLDGRSGNPSPREVSMSGLATVERLLCLFFGDRNGVVKMGPTDNADQERVEGPIRQAADFPLRSRDQD